MLGPNEASFFIGINSNFRASLGPSILKSFPAGGFEDELCNTAETAMVQHVISCMQFSNPIFQKSWLSTMVFT